MNNLLVATAYAQEAAPTAKAVPQQNPIMSFIPLILVFMVFYFLMIRPQKKKMEEEKQYIDNIKKGEEVYTKSGLIGTVYGIAEKVITLELEGQTKIKVLKSHIGGPTKDIFKPATATK